MPADVVDRRQPGEVRGGDHVGGLAGARTPASAASSAGSRRATAEHAPTATRASATMPSRTTATAATIAIEITR